MPEEEPHYRYKHLKKLMFSRITGKDTNNSTNILDFGFGAGPDRDAPDNSGVAEA